MQTHVKVLAVLFIVFSAFGVLAAIALFFLFGASAGIVGAAADAGDAAVAIPIIGLVGIGVVIFLLMVSLPGLVAGFGLLNLKAWARILAIVLCAINLIQFPVGTILGVYGLWVLLNNDTEQLFNVPASLSHP